MLLMKFVVRLVNRPLFYADWICLWLSVCLFGSMRGDPPQKKLAKEIVARITSSIDEPIYDRQG
jgi:hypothetical protein